MTLAEDRNVGLVSVCRFIGVRTQIGFRQAEPEGMGTGPVPAELTLFKKKTNKLFFRSPIY